MEEKEKHICSCLHPKRVRNPFTKEMVTVPCGKCEACTTRKSGRMVQRLQMERMSWKYCVFTTLTYDNDHLPLLKTAPDYLVDVSPSRVHPIKGVKCVQISEALKKIHHYNNFDISRTNQFIDICNSHFGGLPYLSSVDIQRFIKRMRISLLRKYNKYVQNHGIQEKNTPSFRYFCCGEIGPTTFRPHYHVLFFFNSEFFAAYVQEFIRECWKYGSTDTSFVSECNASYVAGYTNSVADLPVIYQTSELRPFCLYSKHPALGSLVYNSETIKSQFLSCDVKQSLLYTSAKLPIDVPLWRTFQDSLYPRLPYFGQLSPRHRKFLYTICTKGTFVQSDRSFQFFVNFVRSCKSEYACEYIKLFSSTDGNLMNKYFRWYSVCMRVLNQSEIFDITPLQYYECIEKFYNNKDYSLLCSQYSFLEKYSQKHDVCELLGLDKQFIDGLSSAILHGFEFSDLDATEQSYLLSFKTLDLDKLFSPDLDVRYTYLYQFNFEFSNEYLMFSEEKKLIYDRSTKTKKKNDYLLAQTDVFYQRIAEF